MKNNAKHWGRLKKQVNDRCVSCPPFLGFVCLCLLNSFATAQSNTSVTKASVTTKTALQSVALASSKSSSSQANLQPASVLKLGVRDKYLLLVSLSEGLLHVFEKLDSGLKKLKTMPVSIGKKGFGKKTEGDKKTPVGVYRITSHLTDAQLDDFYGRAAYPMNYPNVWDRLNRRTGSGIWLHAMPEGTSSRPARDSDGCVVLNNENIEAIASYLDVGYTKVVLTEKAQWQPASETQSLSASLQKAINRWRLAWESKDSTRYLSFYSEDFSDLKKNKAQWSSYKKRINDRKKYIKVALSDLALFSYPGEKGLFLAEFYQDYDSSNFKSKGWKRQLWRRKSNSGWEIIFEAGG